MKIYGLEPNEYFESLDRVINRLEWKLYSRDFEVKYFVLGFILFEFNLNNKEDIRGFIDTLKEIKDDDIAFCVKAITKFFFNINKQFKVKFIYNSDLSFLYNIKLFILSRTCRSWIKSLTKSLRYEYEYENAKNDINV